MKALKKLNSIAIIFLINSICLLGFVNAQDGVVTHSIEKVDGSYVLSLNRVMQLALQNNFDIQLAKYDAQIARTDKGVSESVYDTVIDMELKYRKDKAARTSSLMGSETVDNDYNVGVTKKLPTGTTVSVDMTNNRNWTDSSFATLNPSHDSGLGITIEQELGKNFFGIQDRGDVKITKIDIENSEYTSLDKIEGYLADVQKAYWDLVLQIERLEIEKRMVEQAKKLYDLHQEKVKDGLVENPELYASEANYRVRVNELLLLEDLVKNKENALKLLLNIEDDDVRIKPADSFEVGNGNRELDIALKQAFENRRDYKKTLNAIKSKNINLSMKKSNIWPEINLKASLVRNGVGAHFKDSLGDVGDEDNPNFFAGLTVSFPLENSKAKSQLKAAEIEKAKAIIGVKQIERKITVNIIDQVRNCNVRKESAINRIRIAELQTQKLEEEEKRFNYGRSNTDTLIRFQEDVIQAELLSTQAKFNYHTALVDLELKQSMLLDKYWEGEL